MRKRALAAGIILAVAGVGGLIVVRRQPDPPPGTIQVSGNIEITDAELAFEIPGRVVERPVSEGETLEAGQIVARLDGRELTHQDAQRQAEVAQAEAALAELEAGTRPEEVAEAAAALRAATADRDRLRGDFERQQALFEQEVISARELERAEGAYRMAQGRLDQARERLVRLERGPRTEAIEQARARLAVARSAREVAATRLDHTILRSPIEGFVLAEHVEAGEYVSAGTPIVSVGDLRHPWLRAYVDEGDLGLVKLGQRARVTTDTHPGKGYEGRIAFISAEAEFTPKSVQTEKERVKLVYRIRIALENPALELKPGMPADAMIEIGTGTAP